MKALMKKYVGTRDFYIYVLSIAVPMILQNLITNFVSMLDNIMVGQVGTAQMSGVSIVNQLLFVFNITIFGGVSGASIFGTQFFGKGDPVQQKFTVRFRIILSCLVVAAGTIVFKRWGSDLIMLFLSKDDSPVMIAKTLQYGEEYLDVMLFSLFPFAIGQAYTSVVRECGETRIPMFGSLAAIGVNLFLDYGFIFGHFGMPQMGVKGAAIATVIAKGIEALVVIGWAHTHVEKNPYITGLYQGFKIPWKLTVEMVKKGCPLLANEFLWALGMSVVAQSYSARGLDVVAARNIATTVNNLFSVIYIQLGASIGIIVGAKLGAGLLRQAKEVDDQLVFFSTAITIVVAVCMIPVAKLFPALYNTEPQIKELATYFILVQAIAMPIWAYTNACYFTLRCGGRTGITFLFDFVFSWVVMIPLAFILSHYTRMEIHWLIAIVTYSEVIKAVAGYFLVRSGIWMNNLVDD